MSTLSARKSTRFFFRITTTSDAVHPAIATSSVSMGEGPSLPSPSIVTAVLPALPPLKTSPRDCHEAVTAGAAGAPTSVGSAGGEPDEEPAAPEAVQRLVFDQPVDVAAEVQLESHHERRPDARRRRVVEIADADAEVRDRRRLVRLEPVHHLGVEAERVLR